MKKTKPAVAKDMAGEVGGVPEPEILHRSFSEGVSPEKI